MTTVVKIGIYLGGYEVYLAVHCVKYKSRKGWLS